MNFDKIEKEINDKLRINHKLYKSCLLEYCESAKTVVLHLFFKTPTKYAYESKFLSYDELTNYLIKNELI